MAAGAGLMAVRQAMAKRMFDTPKLYRWVVRNLRTLPPEENIRNFYLVEAREVSWVQLLAQVISATHACHAGLQRKFIRERSRSNRYAMV